MTADLGIPMGTGTGDAIRLVRRTLGTIKGNLLWALAYTILAAPVAALGFVTSVRLFHFRAAG